MDLTVKEDDEPALLFISIEKEADPPCAYVEKYFVWTVTHQRIAEIIKANAKKLNGETVAPIYDDATKDLNL